MARAHADRPGKFQAADGGTLFLAEAARLLGIGERTLWTKLKKYGI